jgi:superfamily II DNA/RNA helicase
MQTKKGKQIRRDALQEMRGGTKNILFATYSLAREGIDIPRLDRLFLASPKKDCAVLEQSLGRISRSFPGKKDAFCYDYADRRIGICIGLYKHRLNTDWKMGSPIRSGGVDTSTVDRADNSALSRLFPSPSSCFIPEPEKPLHTSGYPAAV